MISPRNTFEERSHLVAKAGPSKLIWLADTASDKSFAFEQINVRVSQTSLSPRK